jgi:hypothetical protein
MTPQFHFGNAELDTYRIGERMRWGGNDKGLGQELMEAIGYQEPCDRCGLDEDRDHVLRLGARRPDRWLSLCAARGHRAF